MDSTTGARREMNIDDLKGKNVIDRMGNEIGSVADVSIDPNAWNVAGVIVNVHRDVADRLHLERRMMGEARLQVSPHRIQNVGDNVMLNVDLATIAGTLLDSGSGNASRSPAGSY